MAPDHKQVVGDHDKELPHMNVPGTRPRMTGTWRTSVPDWPRIEKMGRLLVGSLPPAPVLDIGYVRDGLGDQLASRGYNVSALEIDPPEQVFDKVHLVPGDFNLAFPFADETFAGVTAGEVIEHAIDELHFLRECSRVLKKDGILVLSTPNLVYLLNRIRLLFGQIPLFSVAPYHLHVYTLSALRRLLMEAGFQIERTTASHILYSRRRHGTGVVFERLAEYVPTLGAHLILLARKV